MAETVHRCLRGFVWKADPGEVRVEVFPQIKAIIYVYKGVAP